jgi:hypothetical protein
MNHELSKMQLQSRETDLQFLQSYLGQELFEDVSRLFDLDAMPPEVLGVYRKTAEFMAEILPEADHVVRDDVRRNANATAAGIGGNVAVYFGVQSPLFEIRRQFVGLAYYSRHPDKPWTFYIAGATTEDSLRSLIMESPSTEALHGLSFRTVDEFMLIKPKLEAVARFYQSAIAARKGDIGGFIPATAYRLQQTLNKTKTKKNTEDRLEQARKDAYDFFKAYRERYSEVEKAKLKQDFTTTEGHACWEKFVNLIFSGYLPAEVFDVILQELKARLS